MNIRHECPSPELSFAVAAPLFVSKDGQPKITVQRWSLKGIWPKTSNEADPDVDLSGPVVLTIPFQGVFVSFQAKLSEQQEDGAYHFVNLTVRQREALAAFYKGVLSGRMVATEEIITSIDTPVDLVPMNETEAEKEQATAGTTPRSLRIIWNTLFYFVFAGLLFAFLANLIWHRVSTIDLEHARFVAPVVPYSAPDRGYVHSIRTKPGETVAPGDVLIQLSDPDRDSDVENVRMEVLIAERRLLDAQDKLNRHLRNAHQDSEKLRRLFRELHTVWSSNSPRDPVYGSRIRKNWQRLDLWSATHAAESKAFFDMKEALQATLEERQLDLRRWKRELRHKKAAANRLFVRATVKGTISAVHVSKGQFVGRDQILVEVEELRPRLALARLDNDLAMLVYPDMPATITYTYRGETREVAANVLTVEAGQDIEQPDKYGMVLTLKAQGVGVINSRKWFGANAPAHISVERRTAVHRFWERIKSRVSQWRENWKAAQ